MDQSINHHAYVLKAESITESALPERLRIQSVDVLHIIVDKFGIDEARELKEQANQKAVTSEGRIFVLLANSLTIQAQNALLKLLEEPPNAVSFYFLLPSFSGLIPTLMSRLVVLDGQKTLVKNDNFLSFIELSLSEQLDLVTQKTKAKDTIWMNDIINGTLAHTDNNISQDLLSGLSVVGENWGGAGASKKMLLEELILTLQSS